MPDRLDDRPVRRDGFGRVVLRDLAAGSISGAALGAVAGLVIGVRTYLPTFPFAMIEGGIIGSFSGTVVSLLVVSAMFVLKARVRQ